MGRLAPLDDIQNALVKRVLRAKRAPRQRRTRVLVEGVRAVAEALAAGAVAEVALYSPRLIERTGGAQLVERLGRGQGRVLYVTDEILEAVSETRTPQGVLLMARPPAHTLEDVFLHPRPLVVAAGGIQDPGNLGTLMRTAHAMGASGMVAFSGSVDILNPKVVRASMGAIFRMPVVQEEREDFDRIFAQWNVTCYAATVADGPPPWGLDLTAPVALLLGNEGSGLWSEAIARARPVSIPMAPGAESLNVASAGAMLLYEAWRQRAAPLR